MAILPDSFPVTTPVSSGFGHCAFFWTSPTARADGPVADDAHDVRVKGRIDAVDTNRPDYDAVPEHDPDGTPWAA